MKYLSFILVFSACTPYVPAPTPMPVYEDKIAVQFTNQQSTRDFYIQYLNGTKWMNISVEKSVSKGSHYDTIPFLAGMYRIVTQGDSTSIFIIK